MTSGIARYLTTLVRHAPDDIQFIYLDDEDAAYGSPYTTPPDQGWAAGGGAGTGQSVGTPGPTAGLAPAAWRILLWYAREAYRLAAVLRRYRARADIIHVNLVGCEIQTLAARLAGFRRVITTIHNLPGEDCEALAWPRRCVEWLSFACGNHHIGVSKSVCEFWRHRIGLRPRRCSVIYLGIEPVAGGKALEPRQNPGTLFGISARLHPMKGHAVLLEAFKRVVAVHPASRLLIAGAGPEELAIRGLIDRLGLSSAVTLLGRGFGWRVGGSRARRGGVGRRIAALHRAPGRAGRGREACPALCPRASHGRTHGMRHGSGV